MFLYYQSAEDGHQRWEPITEQQVEKVKRESAYHLSIYRLSKLPETCDRDEILYKGDLWFDIDHKPASESPSESDVKDALKRAINDARRLLSYFEAINLNPKYCRIFASGGKGFHICVPASVFDGAHAVKGLPKIHKHMAQVIQERCGAEGIDMQLYCTGMGRLLRVENKQRPNGSYKVPVSYEEVKVMTPESYQLLTKSPRVETVYAADGICSELAVLYSEAETEYQAFKKIQFDAVKNEHLAVFSDGDNPACIKWVTQHLNIKSGDGQFNRAKMSLSRYLMNSPITDAERESLLDDFARNWNSTRCPTIESRKKAVKETLNYGRDNGFSCHLMTSLFTDSPCLGCKLKLEQKRELAARASILESPFGYQRVVARGEGPMLSNFTLQPTCRFINHTDSDNTFLAFEYEIMKASMDTGEKQVAGNITLTHKAWQSNTEFKKQISHVLDMTWTGSDTDLQHLKSHLTNATTLSEVKQTVKFVPTLGINKHVDEANGINEYVWVEDDYSINRDRIINTIKFDGMRLAAGENRAIRMSTVKPYIGTDEETNATLKALFRSNITEIVAPVIGWVFSCWLRTHLRDGDTTDKHLPGLQIYGASGHGKTETATLFSILAGADYRSCEPLVVASSTPYAIRSEATIATTVPRILDEMNEHKCDRQKYSAARDAVKDSARAGSQMRGGLSENGAVVNVKPATSPIIMLATQLNPEQEIQQRTIMLSINSSQRSRSHHDNFAFVRKRMKYLERVAKLAMQTTLALSPEWVFSKLEENHELLPEGIKDNRIGRNWEVVLLGLDYFYHVLELGLAPADILAMARNLKQDLMAWLDKMQAELVKNSISQEIDRIIDTFGRMIVIDHGGLVRKFRHGENYIVEGDTLHLWSTVFFTQYVAYCRNQLGKAPELSSLRQYQDLLSHQPYHLGRGLVQNVKAPDGWNSFHLPELKARGLDIENFYIET